MEIWGIQENVSLVLKDNSEQISSFKQEVFMCMFCADHF